tara:strand:- start:893 stop:1168 length:276 start_codon:yes stop_codon:yes gene_type:complete
MKTNRIGLINSYMKFILTSLLTFIFSFLINTQIVIADQLDTSSQIESDSLERIENTKDIEKSSKLKKSEGDIFGDEQTFPFVAGLGKNAAH